MLHEPSGTPVGYARPTQQFERLYLKDTINGLKTLGSLATSTDNSDTFQTISTVFPLYVAFVDLKT